ncbi:DUF3796 domain-containing protein [Clostridium psychrophilum]|uniref:DUF3796 domain-containing protein n=1 Tax=Clostridium psychrophilum TaxID=132926 RepID=UPI001C0CF580|nr:DUF3796 domain-containing protein [Clostridium psychrophilum]MBU3182934.1 DUF3796 domain-containing protein [Clostridium psychrophilum]
MKNKMGYLRCIGFIGILGLCMGNFAISTFLVFFFFFTYAEVVPDELFKENIKKAALNAFISNMIINTIILIVCTLITNFYHFTTPNSKMLFYSVAAFTLNFVISILIFVFTLIFYGHKEKRSLE